MAEVVLFHHVQGLTEGVTAFADALREAGHTVHTPEVFDGRTFATLDEGIGYAQEVGFGTLQDRAIAAADELSPKVVYAGFSLGVMPAQQLAQTRRGAKGALFFHGCALVSEFGDAWPAGVPVQVHGMDHDPLFTEEDGDLDAARGLVESTDEAELFLYPGKEHLFADSSLSSYDADAAALLTQRTLDFLAKVS